nr:MAG TPA: hypothetical protein [Bacteriophage sp.]
MALPLAYVSKNPSKANLPPLGGYRLCDLLK